jgi:Tol biopolymer transport system component
MTGTLHLRPTSRGGHQEIWMADANGSNARQVTNDGLDAANPTMTALRDHLL